MAVNFNQDSVFNLKPISNDEVRGEVDGLLIADEKVEFAFKTIRDQLVFTNKMCRGLQERENPLRQCRIPKFSIFQFRHRDLWNCFLIQNYS